MRGCFGTPFDVAQGRSFSLGGQLFGGVRLQMVAAMLPRMQWVSADTAQGRATRGVAAKCFWASAAPRPEFCIPTSMDTVRLTSSTRVRSFAAK